MNTAELTDHLRQANPVKSDPPAQPIEPLLARLDVTVRGFQDDAPAAPSQTGPTTLPRAGRDRGRKRVAGRIALACAATLVIALAVFAILGGSGGGTPDVLADAYRALSPGAGVLHMVEVTEQSVAGKTTTTHEELWTAQHPRRLRSVITPSDGQTYEQAFTASPLETRQWSSAERDVIVHGTPAGALTHEQTPVSLLHELIKKGELTVAGKTTLEGRPVWQLAVHPANYTQPVFEGKTLPNPTVYVDASTFAPVELVSESLGHAGGQAGGAPELEVTTTRYTTYEESAKDAQSESLLKLADHPGAVEKNEP